jgi:hypothetical protein
MGSFKAPKHTLKHAFDSDELAVLDRAFESAWAAIETPYPTSSYELEEEVRTHLRRLIFRLAAHGVSDVRSLTDFALIAQSPCLLFHRGDSVIDRYAGLH